MPADDARFRVIHGDARSVIARMQDEADVLLVDGFDAAGLPSELVSSRFYADCRRALVDGGVLVANVFSYDPQYAAALGRLALMFGGRLARPAGVAGNNHIVFAVRASLAGGRAGSGRAVAVQRWLARRQHRLAGVLNRLLVRVVLLWIALRPA